MQNRIPSARTNVDSITNADATTSRPNNAKPHVGCSLSLSGKMAACMALAQFIIVAIIANYLPEKINWFVAMFGNSIGLFFGLLITILFERLR